MYSNVHIPTISDYIATSLTDASTSYITLNADPLSTFIITAIRARSQTNRTPKHKKTEYKISMWHLLKKCQEKSICMLLYVMSSMDSFH